MSDGVQHHDHGRTFQPDIEDSPYSIHQLMAEALERLLIEKGVFTPEALRRQIELQDSLTPAQGSALVANAWVDPSFRQHLLEDVNGAAEAVGIKAGDIPIRAVENTVDLHNVIVCTLCSCYPRQLIGLPPDWYKSKSYRSRAVVEPRAVLKEFGTEVPDNVTVRVHDSNADMRYLVLPKQPEGTEDWPAEKLAEIVSRDAMVGVVLPEA